MLEVQLLFKYRLFAGGFLALVDSRALIWLLAIDFMRA